MRAESTQSHNPNARGGKLLAGTLAMLMGATACASGESTPPPTPTQTQHAIVGPTCTEIVALPTGKAHTMDISFVLDNADRPGEWKVGGADYAFGDGSKDTTQNDAIGTVHTFPKSGRYNVSVDVHMDAVLGAPPVGNRNIVGCPITTIDVP